MTEHEWLTAESPLPLVEYLLAGKIATDRQLRHFVVGWTVKDYPYWRERVILPASLPVIVREVAGSNGGLGRQELLRRVRILRDVVPNPFRPCRVEPAWLTPQVMLLADAAAVELPARPCSLCHGRGYIDYPGPVPTCCPACNGSGSRNQPFLDPVCLGVLADAIEEAGCVEDYLLAHLHEQGSHVSGCWAVETILGHPAQRLVNLPTPAGTNP